MHKEEYKEDLYEAQQISKNKTSKE